MPAKGQCATLVSHAPPPPAPRCLSAGAGARLAPWRVAVTAVELEPRRRRRLGTEALHARRVQWQGDRQRRVPDAVARRATGAPGARGAGGRGRPRPGLVKRGRRGVADRKPVVGRAVGSDRDARHRARLTCPRASRVEPGAARPYRVPPAATPRPRSCRGRVGRGRVDPPRPRRTTPPRSASRSCTTPPARTATRGRRRRRSCAASSSTTCRGTAGTTSATTSSSTASGRSTRVAFGGVDRNVIGAQPGVQHRLGRRRAARDVRGARPAAAAQEAIAGPARVAARRRARRPASALTTSVSSGSERYRSGIPRPAPRRLGAPRHRPHDVPRRRALRPAERDRGEARRSIGLPKLYEPRIDDGRGRRPVPRARCRRRCPGRCGHRRRRGRGRRGAARAPRSTGRGTRRPSPRGAYRWTISSRFGAGRDRPASPRAAHARRSRSRRRGEPETITPNGDGQADDADAQLRLTRPRTSRSRWSTRSGVAVATVVDRALDARRRSDRRPFAGAGSRRHVHGRRSPRGPPRARGRSERVPLTRQPHARARSLAPSCSRRTATGATTGSSSVRAHGAGDVRVRIVRDGRWVATRSAATLRGGRARASRGTGKRAAGRCGDGSYRRSSRSTDAVATAPSSCRFVADTTAPKVGSSRPRKSGFASASPRPSSLAIDGGRLKREVRRPGVVRVPGVRLREARARRRAGCCGQRERAAVRCASGDRRARRVDSPRAQAVPPPRSGGTSIEAILPHREPFLLLDEVLELEPGRRVVAGGRCARTTGGSPGTFPSAPVMPGVLIVEAMAQAGAVAVLDRGGEPREDRVLRRHRRLPVQARRRAGRRAHADVRDRHGARPDRARKATAHVGDELAARGTLTFAVER